MLNYIWAVMILGGFVYGTLTGNLQIMTNSMLEAAKDAVDLSITLLGVIAFWCGIMEIAQESKLIEMLTRRMWPLIHFLFPDIPENHKALDDISTNFLANILGLGWAATPAGLRAMEELEKLEEERRINHLLAKKRGMASNEMCTFLIINISSLQLIPVNVLAYRAQYGSTQPAAVIGPAIAATMVSTAVAVVFCKAMSRKI